MNLSNHTKRNSAAAHEQSQFFMASGVNALKASANHTIDFFQNAIISDILLYRLASSFSPMRSNKNPAITLLDKLLNGNK